MGPNGLMNSFVSTRLQCKYDYPKQLKVADKQQIGRDTQSMVQVNR